MSGRNKINWKASYRSWAKKIPDNGSKLCDSFLAEKQALSDRYEVFFNMDEAPGHFDLPNNTTKEHGADKNKLVRKGLLHVSLNSLCSAK